MLPTWLACDPSLPLARSASTRYSLSFLAASGEIMLEREALLCNPIAAFLSRRRRWKCLEEVIRFTQIESCFRGIALTNLITAR